MGMKEWMKQFLAGFCAVLCLWAVLAQSCFSPVTAAWGGSGTVSGNVGGASENEGFVSENEGDTSKNEGFVSGNGEAPGSGGDVSGDEGDGPGGGGDVSGSEGGIPGGSGSVSGSEGGIPGGGGSVSGSEGGIPGGSGSVSGSEGDVSGGEGWDENLPPRIVIRPETAGESPANRDVSFEVEVTDPDSPLALAEYWVTCGEDSAATQRCVYFPGAEDRRLTIPVTVLAEKNNGDGVVLHVQARDRQGLESREESMPFSIDITPPQIQVALEGDPVCRQGERGYFRDPPRARISITERSSHFDPQEALRGIQIEALDAQGQEIPLEREAMLSPWTTLEGETPDQAVHTAYLTFSEDANYQWEITYTDAAGNESGEVQSLGEAPFCLTVDRGAPQGQIRIGDRLWEGLLYRLCFGIWSREPVQVEIRAWDGISPCRTEFLKVHGTESMSLAELESASGWEPFQGLAVDREELFSVYARVTDLAGNRSYLGSGGVILDRSPVCVSLMPQEPDWEGGYNGSGETVSVRVAAWEDLGELPAAYSGIQSVEYWVTCDGTQIQREILFQADQARDPVWEELARDYEGEIFLDREKNSGQVILSVLARDNAGNETRESCGLTVDAAAPAIQVSFEDTPSRIQGERGYFSQGRRARIDITERTEHFDPERAAQGIRVRIWDAEGKERELDAAPLLSSWSTRRGETPDRDVHTAYISFQEEGNYTWSVSCEDLAGNLSGEVAARGETPFAFTVDYTAPEGILTVGEDSYGELLESPVLCRWGREPLAVDARVQDTVSPWEVSFFVTSDVRPRTAKELEETAQWQSFSPFVLEEDQQAAVYLRLQDYAGNCRYLSSQGYVLDRGECALSLLPQNPPESGIYREDAKVLLQVRDPEPAAGIARLEYWVTCDGTETKREVLYRDPREDEEGAFGESPLKELEREVTVNARENNSCHVILYARARDLAGNETLAALNLDIDVTCPKVEIAFSEEPFRVEAGRGYFPGTRRAVVTVTERSHHFQEKEALRGIQIRAVDAGGRSIPSAQELSRLFSGFRQIEGETPDETKHEAILTFQEDANYTLEISCRDLAGNISGEAQTGSSSCPWAFTVDTAPPSGYVILEDMGTWDGLLQTLVFGLWSQKPVRVLGGGRDAVSPLEEIQYLCIADGRARTWGELEQTGGWRPLGRLTLEAQQRAAVYLRLRDYAGNTAYVGTDGVIVDSMAPQEKLEPRITLEAPGEPGSVYGGDVLLTAAVTEPAPGGVYSGLAQIDYRVLCQGEVTQQGCLYRFDNARPSLGQLVGSWQGEIRVEGARNDSSDVTVQVTARDNAGNVSGIEKYLQIDVTKPQITVTYDNNRGNASYPESVYFQEKRRARIQIRERNFDPDLVWLEAQGGDGAAPVLTGWDTQGEIHRAEVLFPGDGDYRFTLSCTDLAGNMSEGADYGASLAPEAFTVDETPPVISVVWEAPEAPREAAASSSKEGPSEKYYPKGLTALVEIREHNFDPEQVRVLLEARQEGGPVETPELSGWSRQGDAYSARLELPEDGRYSFQISCRDKAGNETQGTRETFRVDKTPPRLEVTGVEDRSANRGGKEDPIGFAIRAWDENFESLQVWVDAVFREEEGFAGRQILTGEQTKTRDGEIFTVENLPRDGIYTVRCRAQDRAGNVCLGDPVLTFSVNREGSVFALGEKTGELLAGEGIPYIRELPGDLILHEINPDPLVSAAVLLNDRELSAGSDYERELLREDGWYHYVYRIRRDLFYRDGEPADGEYRILVQSRDRADNRAYSDRKGCRIHFVVDTVAPDVVLSGLREGGRYRAGSQQAAVRPTDDGGEPAYLEVQILNRSGELTETPILLEGEALREALEKEGGFLHFSMGEGMYQQVLIRCRDRARDAQGHPNEYEKLYRDITVSSSDFQIFWANRPLRYGVLGGAACLVILCLWLIWRRRRGRE